MFPRRFIHTSKMCFAAVQTSALAKLRKATGYSMLNCKKALELHNEDIEKAETWLHAEAQKEGWAKMGKLQNRRAAQGLIAVYAEDTLAAMVEVNCETDFVARNAEFQELVTKVLSSCVRLAINTTPDEDYKKLHLGSEQLGSLPWENTNIADLTALAVGKLAEKTVLKRAVCMRTKGRTLLSCYAHPPTRCTQLPGGVMGRYGAIVAFKEKDDAGELPGRLALAELGSKLCQHVVGMNPESIGKITDEEILAIKQKKQQEEIVKNQIIEEEKIEDEDKFEEDEGMNTKKCDVKEEDKDETRLLHQDFLADPDLTVAEVLADSSVEVVNFERFECGSSDS